MCCHPWRLGPVFQHGASISEIFMTSIKSSYFPTGFFNIFGSEFASRFSFWAVQSVIVLYLTQQFLMTDSAAYGTAASYEALTYAATFFGGLIADKYLGPLRVLMIGITFSIVGMMILGFAHHQAIYLGLGFLVVGMGLYIPTNTSLLDHLYEKSDTARERGFFYFYIATNIGGILAPILFGFLVNYFSYKVGFISCAGLLCLFLFLYWVTRHRVKYLRFDTDIIKKSSIKKIMLFVFGLIVLSGAFFFLIKKEDLTRDLLFVVAIAALIWIFSQSKSETKQAKKSVMVAVGFSIISLLFFAVEFQILNSVILFTRDFVDKKILWMNVPPSTVVSLEPFFVVMMTPIINAFLEKGRQEEDKASAYKKFSMSFLLLGMSFFILSLAASHYKNSLHLLSPLWLVISAFFMSSGEVFLMPVLLAMVTKDAPDKLKNSLVGFLYICISFSSYLSGVIAKLTERSHAKSAIVGYCQTYKIIFLAMVGVSALLYVAYYRNQRNILS